MRRILLAIEDIFKEKWAKQDNIESKFPQLKKFSNKQKKITPAKEKDSCFYATKCDII